jgi:ketosteroid isomerase-like protein
MRRISDIWQKIAPAVISAHRELCYLRGVHLGHEPGGATMTEAEIQQRVADYVSAIGAKDIARVASFFAPSLVSFDLEPPLRYTGAENKRQRWAEGFAAFDSITYEVRELHVATQGDLAFVHGLNHFNGTQANGHVTNTWVRWTACFRRIAGVWLIVHDHVSVPADLPHGRAILDLIP